MYELILANGIVFFASVLQAATGFGFAIMATPFLLLVFHSRDCIQMSILLSFFIAIVLIPKIWRGIQYDLLHKLIVGSIIGVPIGVAFFAYISLDILKISIGTVILVISLVSLVKWYASRNSPNEVPVPVADNFALRQEDVNSAKRQQLLVGMCAGALTTSVGMPGVPLALYFNVSNSKKEVIRSTTLAFFIVVYSISIIAQAVTVEISGSVVRSSLALLPAAALGVVCGYWMFPKMNQKWFQLIVNGILLYTAGYLLINTL
ncbi:MAG: hypothetical protein H6Q66_1959 [Firmicutes bacterium]|nr:hypothetical protein [Bacillota bacterium]